VSAPTPPPAPVVAAPVVSAPVTPPPAPVAPGGAYVTTFRCVCNSHCSQTCIRAWGKPRAG
jgi:hypothetical protein